MTPETRSAEARAADLAAALPRQVARALAIAPAFAAHLGAVEPGRVTDRGALARLPVLRKAALVEAQRAAPPFGGFAGPVAGYGQVFQSPGPIYEPGGRGRGLVADRAVPRRLRRRGGATWCRTASPIT